MVRVLAEDLGLSPTPIKEALAALEREGLVVAVPHRGYHVPRITLRDASGNGRLARVAEAFSGQIRLLIGTSAVVPGRMAASLREHAAIVRAVAARDPAAAEAAMRHHVRQAGIALRAHLARDGSRAAGA